MLSGAVCPPRKARAVGLKNAKATFEQKGFRVANVLVDNSAGWAIHPKTHKNQSATFETVAPLSLKDRTPLTFTLKHAAIANFNIGRFRLSITPDARVGAASKWTQLTPLRATSAGGATLKIAADNSILAGGKNPDRDTYTVVARTSLRRVTGFRLEVLADPTLPDTGPGRDRLAASGIRGNFVLTSFKVDFPADIEKTARTMLHQSERARRTTLSDKVGAKEIIFTVREKSRDGHWYANIGWLVTRPETKLYGDGGQLCRLNLLTGKLAVIIADPKGGIRDPQMHYDGKKILFSMRKSGSEYYHLYEINVNSRRLRQLTSGPFDDIEPAYMPNGDIMFCSTRCNSWVACGWYKVTTLHRCDANGGNIRKISSNIVNEDTPWMLPDGRVLYMRWEYVDRSNLAYQHLWTVNPDGTGQMVYYGNQFREGGVYCDAKPIPGTNRVVYVNSPGHGRADHQGVLMTVDSRRGPDDRSLAKPLNLGPQFAALQGRCYDPYPCSENCFLFACGRNIYLTDGAGDTRVIYTLGNDAPRRMIVQEPRPLRRRRREKVIPSRVDLSKTVGRMLLANVNHGRRMKGVKPGQIKKLLVLEQLAKPAGNMGGWHHPISMGHPQAAGRGGIGNCGTFTLKRILGTVPVEPDGSAWFEAPAMRSLFFVALDENDMSVKRMQSYVTLQPGEVTGCVGCHENRTDTHRTLSQQRLQATRRPPSKIAPVRDVPDVMDFPRDIQPILDRHCVSCHRYQTTGKNAPRSGGVILTGDRGPWFSHAYAALTVRRLFSDGRNGGGNRPPRSIGSSASRLMKMLDGKHYKVRVSPHQRKMIRLWIETGAAYPGTYSACGSGMIDIDPSGVWGTITERGVYRPSGQVSIPAPREVLDRRCLGCHKGRAPLHPQLLYNLTHPARSMVLLAPLAKKAGGYGLCVHKNRTKKPNGSAGFASKSDRDYKAILVFLRKAGEALNKTKRFDMPGFRPPNAYIREMKNYGILPASFNAAKDPVDVYKLDRAYWRSLWHKPSGSGGQWGQSWRIE
jgi:hypothetical protein